MIDHAREKVGDKIGDHCGGDFYFCGWKKLDFMASPYHKKLVGLCFSEKTLLSIHYQTLNFFKTNTYLFQKL